MTKGKKRGKAVENYPEPKVGGANGVVPQVPGDDLSDDKPVHARERQLSRVPRDNSDRKSEKLHGGTKKMEQSVDYKDLNLDAKISLLNAFKKIADRGLKLTGMDSFARSVIESKYSDWVESQMLLVFAEPEAEESLTPSETAALKVLANKILNQVTPSSPKVGVKKSASVPVPPEKTPLLNSLNSLFPPPAEAGKPRPIVDRKKSDQDFINKLDRMDKEGPEF